MKASSKAIAQLKVDYPNSCKAIGHYHDCNPACKTCENENMLRFAACKNSVIERFSASGNGNGNGKKTSSEVIAEKLLLLNTIPHDKELETLGLKIASEYAIKTDETSVISLSTAIQTLRIQTAVLSEIAKLYQ